MCESVKPASGLNKDLFLFSTRLTIYFVPLTGGLFSPADLLPLRCNNSCDSKLNRSYISFLLKFIVINILKLLLILLSSIYSQIQFKYFIIKVEITVFNIKYIDV